MKIMFNDLDRPFKLLNSRYIRETLEILYFAKHHNLTLSLSIYTRFVFNHIQSVRMDAYKTSISFYKVRVEMRQTKDACVQMQFSSSNLMLWFSFLYIRKTNEIKRTFWKPKHIDGKGKQYKVRAQP
jgi:hypothetical protein